MFRNVSSSLGFFVFGFFVIRFLFGVEQTALQHFECLFHSLLMGSLQPLVPTGSKPFVQFQKVHRIIHPLFRTVRHLFGSTSPEPNHFLRQSDYGLFENGSHNRKQQSGKNGVHTERQFFLHFILRFHFFLRLGCLPTLFLNIWSHDVFVNTQKSLPKNTKSHPIYHKSSRFSLGDKKSANHGSLPVFPYLGSKITWFALTGHVSILPALWLVENKKVRNDAILDIQMSKFCNLIGRETLSIVLPCALIGYCPFERPILLTTSTSSFIKVVKSWRHRTN